MAVETAVPEITYLDYLWCLLGVVILAGWCLYSRLGREAWGQSRPRRHQWQVGDVLLVGALFLGSMVLGSSYLSLVRAESWGQRSLGLAVIASGQMMAAGCVLVLGKKRFIGPDRLGWCGQSWGRTFLWSLGYFLAGSGLASLGLILTIWVCRWVGFEDIQQHTLLEMLREHPPAYALILMIVMPAILAPVCEELVFRGLLQNFLIGRLTERTRQILNGAEPAVLPDASPYGSGCRWWGIFLTSLIFPVLHGQWQHWPALFMLSMVLGYAYERHGSLGLSILVHGWFNLFSLVASLWMIYLGD